MSQSPNDIYTDYEGAYSIAYDEALAELPNFLGDCLEGRAFATAVCEELARLYTLANDPKTPKEFRRLLPGRLISMIDIALDHHADEEASKL